MYNINVSLNKTLVNSMKSRITTSGYSNVSEYIRDLLRRDLKLVKDDIDDYPYDFDYINEVRDKALQEYAAGKCKKLTSLADLLE